MPPSPHPRTIEPRWPVALTIGVVLVLLTMLPDRIRVFPVWLHYLLGIAILLAIALVPLTGGKPRSLRFERWITLLFCLFVGTGTCATCCLRCLVHRATWMAWSYLPPAWPCG